ncbi:MAG: hypothetical protein ACFFE8_10315 [Candidatus Heimdallarchaeota archaeon]
MSYTSSLINTINQHQLLTRLRRHHGVIMAHLSAIQESKLKNIISRAQSTDLDVGEFFVHIVLGWT